jgi:photosynthetic reaction center cytochrome c subunit
MSLRTLIIGGILAAIIFLLYVPDWNVQPVDGKEIGFPQAIQFDNLDNQKAAYNQAPPPLPAAATGGPSATEVYKNVQVLTDVSAAEFMRTQQALTNWVSPTEGCGFCHAGQDYASDAKPTKSIARVMLKMVRHINADWKTHVSPAGVTCYTCHRGQPQPAQIWYKSAPVPVHPGMDKPENWQEAADTVLKFFPDAGYQEYYLQDEPIRVQSSTALPSQTVSSQIEAKRIYEMMMTLSDGIGVNCGYCHNSRALADWSQSSPFRWSGESGLQLMRDINRNFLLVADADVPLTRRLQHETDLPVLPARQEGVQNGNGLALCGTCHTGLPKPLNGVNVIDAYPALTPASARPPA